MDELDREFLLPYHEREPENVCLEAITLGLYHKIEEIIDDLRSRMEGGEICADPLYDLGAHICAISALIGAYPFLAELHDPKGSVDWETVVAKYLDRTSGQHLYKNWAREKGISLRLLRRFRSMLIAAEEISARPSHTEAK